MTRGKAEEMGWGKKMSNVDFGSQFHVSVTMGRDGRTLEPTLQHCGTVADGRGPLIPTVLFPGTLGCHFLGECKGTFPERNVQFANKVSAHLGVKISNISYLLP